jgi:hypothetical protein
MCCVGIWGWLKGCLAWAFAARGMAGRGSFVKLALPALQEPECFHGNAIDLGQLDRGRRRGVTMYRGRAASFTESGSEQGFSTIGGGRLANPGEAGTVSVSDNSSEAQSTPLTVRVVRALENRTRPSTLSIGAGLVRRTPGIAVSKASLAFPASDCNGWARLCGLAQGRKWRRTKTCEPSA